MSVSFSLFLIHLSPCVLSRLGIRTGTASLSDFVAEASKRNKRLVRVKSEVENMQTALLVL